MPMPTINKPLGDYVRKVRTAKGLTKKELVARSGLHTSYWAYLQAGKYRCPSPKHLHIIAKTLECPIEDLYALVGLTEAKELPSFAPYMRSKYQLPPSAIQDLEDYFTHLRSYYQIPDDQPVFPPKPKAPGSASEPGSGSGSGSETKSSSAPSKEPFLEGKNRDHPWRQR